MSDSLRALGSCTRVGLLPLRLGSGLRRCAPHTKDTRNAFCKTSLQLLLGLLLVLAGCRSPGVTVQIVNQTPGPIRTLEVLYPGGSYGIANLVRGNSHAKWIKPSGDGALIISFLDAAGQKHTVGKILIKRGYAGGLAIVLLPLDKVKVEDHTRSAATDH